MIRVIFNSVNSKKTKTYKAFNKPLKKAVLDFIKEDDLNTVTVYSGYFMDTYDKNNIEEFEC